MYFDLEYTMRTDGAFKHKLIKLSEDFKKFSEKAANSSRYTDLANEKLCDIIKHCQHNFTYLMPYYYPQYPKMEDMSLKDFPFAYHIMAMNIGGYMVIRGSRQIAKSTTIAARQRMFAHILPRFKSIYIAPKSDQLATYANKFRDLEMAFRFNKQHHKFRQNLFLKEYANGSTIELFNVDTQVTNIRGKSADELIFDEYQNFDPEFEPEVSEIQSATEMPITIYAGTSLTTDSALEIKYENSSQGVWVMTCRACNHDNIPLPEYNVMDMIQPKGVCCSKCGALLDVTNGRFMHLNQEKFLQGQYGFHIPQIIVPFVVENKIRYSEIYRKKLEQDPRKFFQENLGIPTEEGEREITEGDLRNMCMLGGMGSLQAQAKDHRYRLVISGCDWGGSDYDISLKTKLSYTVHVMLGMDIDGRFDIIHMKRYEGMSYRPIAEDIMQKHQELGGQVMGCDFGVGMAYNMLLRERMDPARHLIFNYSGPTSVPLKENPHQFNQYSLNKTESITTLYIGMKQGRIRCYDWAIAKKHLLDLLNLYRVPTDNPSGSNAFVYRRHAAKADDTLHAINFAYVVGRMFRQEPIVEDKALLARISQAIRPMSEDDWFDDQMPKAFSG
tara:strand:+ start:4395 stop:6230 length:1836 start_codon:yes stop_codon:yes gene_type:complete